MIARRSSSTNSRRCTTSVQREQALCERCQTIDHVVDFHSLRPYDLGTARDISQRTSCVLCQLVFRLLWRHPTIVKEADRDTEPRRCLMAPVWSDPFAMPSRYCIVYGDTEIGVIDLLSPRPYEDFPPPSVDPNVVVGWLNTCEMYHGCDYEHKEMHPCSESQSPLLLIDVHELCLIRAHTGYRYVALSYMRGTEEIMETTTDNYHRLLQPAALKGPNCNLPLVIQDAIELVKAIQECYLWVDCLCIVQDDAEQKHSQIAQMNITYSEAFLTIAALSGTDANSVLPGIRDSSRQPIHVIKRAANAFPRLVERYVKSLEPHPSQGDFSSIAIPPSLDTLINSMLYETRGWTFQERILSKRCLYFTEHQIFYHCHYGLYSEIDPHEKQLLREWTNPLHYESTPHACEIPSALGILDKYNQLVTVYTRRRLSYQYDILNAFSGIMTVLERSWHCRFLHGLPQVILHLALLWIPAGPICRRIVAVKNDWQHTVPFPSWSWAGWVGAVEYETWNIRKRAPTESLIHLVMQNDPVIDSRPSTLRELSGTDGTASNVSSHSSSAGEELRFWAFATDIEHFSLSQAEADGGSSTGSVTLIMDAVGQHCGIFIDYGSLQPQSLANRLCELVIISCTDTWPYFPAAQWSRSYQDGPILYMNASMEAGINYRLDGWDPSLTIFNVMLIEWTGECAERLAVGMMHAAAFNSDPSILKKKLIRLV